jgi:biotin carboxyl carrier protein
MTKTEIVSPVTGTVWKVELALGDQVNEGDIIMILESMKMEIPVEASSKGVVSALMVKPGDSVEDEQVLCVVES